MFRHLKCQMVNSKFDIVQALLVFAIYLKEKVEY